MKPSCFAKRNSERKRNGGAVVELAVCLPLLVLLTLGTIDACGLIFMKQSLKIAAYEASRVGLVSGASQENVQAQIDQILEPRNITDYTFTTEPADLASLVEGDFFRVIVSAPTSSNSLIGGSLFSANTFNESVEVMVER